MRSSLFVIYLFVMTIIFGCSSSTKESAESQEEKSTFQLMTLDPGHFHAALVQKMQLEDVDPTVYVYAPEGSDVQDHLNRI